MPSHTKAERSKARIQRPKRRLVRSIARTTSALIGGDKKTTKRLTKTALAQARTGRKRFKASEKDAPTSPAVKKRGRRSK